MSVFWLGGCGMRWFWYRRVLVVFGILGTILGARICLEEYKKEGQEISTQNINDNEVIVGGMPIGIYMDLDGVLVLDTEMLEDKNGEMLEPAKRLVKPGDYITAINGESVDNKSELMEEVSNLSEPEVVLHVRREEELFDVKFNPVEISEDEYKLGIWVRDSVQGLGTLTFLTSDNRFGALGHGIHDTDTDSLVDIEKGNIYDISIVGIQKGRKGSPGGLEGVIIYNKKNILGTITENTKNGIFGELKKPDELIGEEEYIEICNKKDVEVGDAQIRCSVEGVLKEYDVRIRSIDYFTKDANKGLVIEVVDQELIEKAGGIVQGMSGSPIIQDGKLVGAVTHVLVNDPTRGYGIFIENMIEAAS